MDDDADTAGAAASSQQRRLTFLDLPEETQKGIFSYCDIPELVCLSLVSRHFRGLAAEQLYRTIHISFPCDIDQRVSDFTDDLPASLETFTTSDYNYAKHLRELGFDTRTAGVLAENGYKNYTHGSSSGRFLNTLLLLTLRRAFHLETFIWNVRIELSRQIYKTLHQIPTLVNVQVRLQSGPSQYESPPPLPLAPTSSSSSVASSSSSIIGPTHAMDSTLFPGGSFAQMPPPPGGVFGNPHSSSLFYSNATLAPSPPMPMHLPVPVSKPPARAKAPKHLSSARDPPTFSGFKNLKSLGVLDIDSLDILSEIKTCVRNSSGTLTHLSLSFSDMLAAKARKPPPSDIDTEDSDMDDEFQPVPVAPPPMSMAGDDLSSTKAMSAQEERKSQESALGRIFDVEPYLINQPRRRISDPLDKQMPSDGGGEGDAAEAASKDPKSNEAMFILAVCTMAERFMSSVEGTSDLTAQKQQETLELIETAAKQYVHSSGTGTTKGQETGEKGERSKKDGEADQVVASGSGKQATSPEPGNEDGVDSGSLFHSNGNSTTRTKARADNDVSPEDIDIEEPEGQLILDPQDEPLDNDRDSSVNNAASGDEEEANAADSDKINSQDQMTGNKEPQKTPQQLVVRETSSKAMAKLVANLAAQKMNHQVLLEKLRSFEEISKRMAEKVKNLRQTEGGVDLDRVADTERQMRSFRKAVDELYKELRIVEAEVEDAQRQIEPALAADKAAKDAPIISPTGSGNKRELVNEYVRSTRGLALEEFSAHQIPVKASVLSRAIDLRVLQNIALLNVGPQAPIWSLLAKENKVQPLPLRSIFTDNVTLTFLNFVGQLDQVRNLFLLEREPKSKVPSFAEKTTTTIEQIRRLALRKHAAHLRRLVIRNSASKDWDLDEATVKFLARRATNLKELGVIMNMKSIHAFLQQLPSFVSLVALHIIRLRNDDTCMWAMTETRLFMLDTLSHYPQLKLEWMSVDSGHLAEHIVRIDSSKDDKKKKKAAEKEKGKATAVAAGKTVKAKGKEKAVAFGNGNGNIVNASGAYIGVDLVNGWLNFSDAAAGNGSGGAFGAGKEAEDDESDESDSEAVQPLKFKLESFRFADIWEVRIFRKGVVTGQL